MANGSKKRKVMVIRRIPTSTAVKYNNDFFMRIKELPHIITNGSNMAHDMKLLLYLILKFKSAQSY